MEMIGTKNSLLYHALKSEKRAVTHTLAPLWKVSYQHQYRRGTKNYWTSLSIQGPTPTMSMIALQVPNGMVKRISMRLTGFDDWWNASRRAGWRKFTKLVRTAVEPFLTRTDIINFECGQCTSAVTVVNPQAGEKLSLKRMENRCEN